MPTTREVEAMLTGTGGMFEVVTETVRGIPMKVFKNRMQSLREIPAGAVGRGDEDFVVYGDRRYSYAEFVDLANSVSASLAADVGIGAGDRVAVLSANNPEWCLAFWGTVDLGAILVGLNGWWKTDEILYGLEDSGSRVLIADRGRFERVKDELGSLPDLDAIYLIGCDPADVGLADDKRVHRFDELLGRRGQPLPSDPIDEDSEAVIFYTSGTTGRPKGAISTHRSMISNLFGTLYSSVAGSMLNPGATTIDPTAKNASLLTSPLFHVSGCHSGLVVALLAGIKIVIPPGRFEPGAAMQLIEDEKITVWATVPTMVWRVVEDPRHNDYDLSSITAVAYGGSPSAAELQRRIKEVFPNVRTTSNAYGLTESSSAVTVNSGKNNVERPDSVGRPLPVIEVRIMGPDSESGDGVPAGSTGEVWLRGPHIMPGYWKKPEATAETITADGWLRTGDLGHVDEDGFLYITDRAKDMIIRGGENVYCVEIENRLIEHPAIAEAAIIGVPHPTLGEEVKAVIRLEEGESLSEDGVRAWVRETLADFKVPAYIEFVTERLPRNPSGKLLKNVLRGEGEVSFAETL
jgi:long-chain acyl-CoA synthetase